MSKILVIPDTHLKPWMFDKAAELLDNKVADKAIVLGDVLDDFYKHEEDYREHNARIVWFNLTYPNTIWLLGNHEMSYIYDRPVTGNIREGKEYAQKYIEICDPKIIHIEDNVIFSHAGVFTEFLDLFKKCYEGNKEWSLKEIVDEVNEHYMTNMPALWNDDSPLWARPEWTKYHQTEELLSYLQVRGHTPRIKNIQEQNILTTDCFSTDWGKSFGEEKFIVVDTITKEWTKME